MRGLAKKGLVAALLIIGVALDFISFLSYAVYAVKEYDWYDSLADYFSEARVYRTYGVLLLLIFSIIFSLYTKKKKVGKTVLVIAFVGYGVNTALVLFYNMSYIIEYIGDDRYYLFQLLTYISILVVVVLTIIDVLVNNKFIKVSKIIYIIAGIVMVASDVNNLISSLGYSSSIYVCNFITWAGTLVFWFALILWTMYLRKPIHCIEENYIEKLLIEVKADYDRQLITEKGYAEKKKAILEKIK